MGRLAGALLVVIGCAGTIFSAYRLCAQASAAGGGEPLGGLVGGLLAAAIASLAADAVGLALVAWLTRPGRPGTPGADPLDLERRPGWATALLLVGVLVPLSVALWFGILCRVFR
jgi:hypothetical protein